MAKKRARIKQDIFDSTAQNEKQPDSKSSKADDSNEPVKKGNTYYLTEDTYWRLDAAKAQLRRMTGENISKSDIVEAALLQAFSELETRGDDSYLAILLSKKQKFKVAK